MKNPKKIKPFFVKVEIAGFSDFLDAEDDGEVVDLEETSMLLVEESSKRCLAIFIDVLTADFIDLNLTTIVEKSLDSRFLMAKILNENAKLKKDAIKRIVLWKVKNKLLAAAETKKGGCEQLLPIDAIAIAICGMWPIYIDKKLLKEDKQGLLEEARSERKKIIAKYIH